MARRNSVLAAVATPLAAALLLVAAPAAAARTLRVPSEDYPSFQEALDASSDGDTILVAAGTYSSSVSVSERSNLRIRGVPGTILDSSGIFLADCERATIEGIEFVDATDTGLAVHATGCTRLTLKNLRIEGFDGAQILLEDCDGARVTKCTVVDGPGAGLRDVGSTGLVVEKCTFTGNGGWAIDLSPGEQFGSDGARVAKNTITGPDFGISAEGSDLRIEGNTVTLVEGPGIRVGDAFDAPGALVQRNTVVTTGVPHRALYVGGSGVRLARNTVSGGAGVGIFVEGGGNRIEGNTVTGGPAQGFHLDGNDNRITGNLAQGVGGESFVIRQGQRAQVTRNRALDAGGTGFQIAQPDAVLTKNVCEGANYAFSLDFPPVTLIGNVAVDSNVADVFSLYSESQYVLSKNRFETFMWDVVIDPI